MNLEQRINRRGLLTLGAAIGTTLALSACGKDILDTTIRDEKDRREDLSTNHLLGTEEVKNEQSPFTLKHPGRQEDAGYIPSQSGITFQLRPLEEVVLYDDERDTFHSTGFIFRDFVWPDGYPGISVLYANKNMLGGQNDPHEVVLRKPDDTEVDGRYIALTLGEEQTWTFEVKRSLHPETGALQISFIEVEQEQDPLATPTIST